MKNLYRIPVLAVVLALCGCTTTQPTPTATPVIDPTDDTAVTTSEDAMKFKEEYEALNNTTREGTDNVYHAIEIPETNPIKYLTVSEAIDVIQNQSGIFYVGAPWCPWCRNAVPVLLEIANNRGVDTIYYLELDDVKSLYEVQDGELVQTREGTEGYYTLLNLLGDKLREYTLTDDDGNEYDAGETRIYMPYVFAFDNGEVLADHTGTVDLDDDQTSYDPMTQTQIEDLMVVYEGLFDLVDSGESSSTGCDVLEECN